MSVAIYPSFLMALAESYYSDNGHCFDRGGSPSHTARKPVPLQSEQQVDPWEIQDEHVT